MRLYVGNLPFSANDDELREVFGQFGEVVDATHVTDRESGRPRGFGFVEMKDEAAGREAISKLDGQDMGGRNIKVNEARPKTEGARGGGDRRW